MLVSLSPKEPSKDHANYCIVFGFVIFVLTPPTSPFTLGAHVPGWFLLFLIPVGIEASVSRFLIFFFFVCVCVRC